MICAHAGHLIREARLRTAVVMFLTAILLLGIYWIFNDGFRFLRAAITHEATLARTVHGMFNLFFMALLAMLTVSSGLITYGTLFRSADMAFLLSQPARPARIVLHKFHETVAISGWGFLIMALPMLLAYGVVVGAPWYYFALLPFYVVAFVIIPTGIGAAACLVVVRFLPTLRVHAIVLAGIVILGGAGLMMWRMILPGDFDLTTPKWFRGMLGRLHFAEQRLLPSWWLSTGLLEAAHPSRSATGRDSSIESLGFLAVLVANAMAAQILVMATGKRWLRAAASGIIGMAPSKRRPSLSLFDRAALRLTFLFPRNMQTLLIKDLRIFRRDPIQWSQFIIFFGLLVLYFVNIRRFQYGDLLSGWVNAVGYLNVGVVALIFSTFTTRFIFPMMSLEGLRFWILGTLPVHRGTILREKFAFACICGIVPCSLLVLLSDVMLQITSRTPMIAVVHQIIIWELCLGLSALAVGLGARLPSLRETSPSKIAAGFGGTLSLVISAMYVLTSVLLPTVATHLWVAAHNSGHAQPEAIFAPGSFSLVIGATGLVTLMSLIMTIVPLRLGLRAFEDLEF